MKGSAEQPSSRQRSTRHSNTPGNATTSTAEAGELSSSPLAATAGQRGREIHQNCLKSEQGATTALIEQGSSLHRQLRRPPPWKPTEEQRRQPGGAARERQNRTSPPDDARHRVEPDHPLPLASTTGQQKGVADQHQEVAKLDNRLEARGAGKEGSTFPDHHGRPKVGT
jgi:hypothetical protein